MPPEIYFFYYYYYCGIFAYHRITKNELRYAYKVNYKDIKI